MCIYSSLFLGKRKRRDAKGESNAPVRKAAAPKLDDLPDGEIDWGEISDFIEDMLAPDTRLTKGWKILRDPAATAHLQANSLAVLNTLYDDLYEHFYKQRGERFEIWKKMEQFAREKYEKLSDHALSRIITVYHIDDL